MFKEHTKKYSLKTLLPIFSFMLIYSTTGILLAQQVVLFTHEKNTRVKDQEFSTPPAGRVTNENTIEPLAPTNDKPAISTYIVEKGDTVASIAKKFDISENTIRFANELSTKAPLKAGKKLIILPVTGIAYIIEKGDTLSSIAKKFHTDETEIISFNDISGTTIKIGKSIIIPDAEPLAPTKEKIKKELPPKEVAPHIESATEKTLAPSTAPAPIATPPIEILDAPAVPHNETAAPLKNTDSYFTMPIPSAHISQGLHGYNSVDFAAPVGTPVYAAAGGTVIVAKSGNGFSGGYGNYIVISHPNGTQTLYAHLSKVAVQVEDEVKQGSEIGKCGRTGRATGPHLHFEVRGGMNPWVGEKVGTEF
jgi:murein DD-endopeptidase MepM/ murein hydrolase activator NlpD